MKKQTKILWLLIVLITFFSLSAKGQHVGIENAMLDIPVDKDSNEVILTGFIPQCPCCKIPTQRTVSGASTMTLAYYPPVYDEYGNNINPDRNTVTSSYTCNRCLTSYSTSGNAHSGYSYHPLDCIEFSEFEIEPTDRNFRTVKPMSIIGRPYSEKYDSNQYVRISEFQELKQKLRDQREEFKREIALHILARFCTFMSPEKAAIEAVRYAEALLKELEK